MNGSQLSSGGYQENVVRRGAVSQAQKVIWTGYRLDPTAPVFNTAWRIDFGQIIDPVAFENAFNRLVSSTDILRLVIQSDVDGMPELIDLGHAAGRHHDLEFATAEAADQWIDNALRRPLNIESESFESALIRVAEGGAIWYLNQHHAIVDASTGSLLLNALSGIYEGRDDVTLPSFFDHAAGEAKRIIPDHVAHWEDREPPASLPRMFGKQVSGRSSSAVMRPLKLNQAQKEKLNALILQPGFRSLSREMSLFNVFLTVFSGWMHRVSGEMSVPVGVVAHGRSSAASRSMPGCFVEIFPTSLHCQPEFNFQELHSECVERSLETFKKASPGSSSPRALTSFNAILNFVTARFSAFAGETPKVTWLDNGHIDQHHAIRLNVTELSDEIGLECQFAFNVEVFDDARQQAVIDQFSALLDAFLDNPDASVFSVLLSKEGDAATKLAKTVFSPAPVADVMDAFAAHLAADPEANMFYQSGQSFSRRMLSERSDNIARALHRADVKPGDRIGLHLQRSFDLVASMLACLKLDVSFVPLDPSQTAYRLDAIAQEAKLAVAITDETLQDKWRPPVTTLLVEEIGESAGSIPKAKGTAPAYVIFTSGTTGTPKGVEVGRASLSRYANWANRVFADGESLTWPLFSAIGFDLTITSIFAPIVSGGTIRAYPEDQSTSVLDVFTDDAVDVVKLTPAHLRLVLASGVGERKRIRSLVLGGEDLPTHLAKATKDKLGKHIRIFNEYGPTEATIGCMIHEFDDALDRGISVPIGRPAKDTGIYILDKGLNPVPDDVAGDLYIAGPERLATGYFDRPDETAKAFVSNPFAEGVMYRSGDIASVRSDETILYHGRADAQVKISGVRIETGEILAAAQSIEGIDDCAITLFDPVTAAQKLCRTCGIPKAQPGVRFAEPNLCFTCKEFDDYRAAVDDYFGDLDQLAEIIRSRANNRTGQYDCVMLLSGGKDSTYALSQLIEITDRVLVATLDNGFISEGAKENIRLITERLGVDHRYLSTPAMNDIFVDSLKRHANVCQGCFKTIYTLGLHLAREVGAPTILTGLSRGQLFETRLAPELFAKGKMSSAEIDDMVLEARRSYHTVPDIAAQRLNCGLFDDPELLNQVSFVDFYRYADVPLSKMYQHLEEKVGWSKPMDTGRSTNCLINDVGIHMHRTRRAFHNYALPYSWDVRLGHKTRAEAVDELNDDIDLDRVATILDEIGFDEPIEAGTDPASPKLTLFFASSKGLSQSDLRAELLRRLPREVVPDTIVQVQEIPLTANGKVDTDALPTPDVWRDPVVSVADAIDDSGLSDDARDILEIWRRVLRQPGLSVETNFYDAGGDSLSAIQIAAQANAAGYSLEPTEIFRLQTVAAIVENLHAKPAAAKPARPRRALSTRNSERLATLFGAKSDD